MNIKPVQVEMFEASDGFAAVTGLDSNYRLSIARTDTMPGNYYQR